MDISSIDLINLTAQKMNHLAHRQKVISQNVANADQPGYRARDIKPFEDYVSLSNGASMRTTHPGHLTIGARNGKVVPVYDDSGTAKLSGNTVSLEREMIKSAEIMSQYNLSSSVFEKSVSMLKAPLGR